MKQSTFLVGVVLIVTFVAIAGISFSTRDGAATNRAGMAASPGLADGTRYLGPPVSSGGEAGDSGSDGQSARYLGPPVADTTPSYDVIVAGAGSGGIAAAIQAARMGASVLIIEETDVVGGQIIPVGNMDGGYTPPAGTGIYEEFESRMRAYYADTRRFPPSGKSIGTCYWNPGTSCFEPRVSQLILRQMLAENGVALRLTTKITAVTKEGSTVTGVITPVGAFRSEVLIDATEYGDIIPLTGARYLVGNSVSPNIRPDSCVDDITYTVAIRKYDAIPAQLRMSAPPPGYTQYREEFKRIVGTGNKTRWDGIYPTSWPIHNGYRGIPDSSRPGSYTGTQGANITKTYINWANDYPAYATYNPLPQGKLHLLNVSYIEDPAERRRMECEAKLKTINFIYYMQDELKQNWSVSDEGHSTPYNNARLCPNIPVQFKAIERQFPPFPYVRESRRIMPIDVYNAQEMKASRRGTPVPSSIAVGEYGVDKHNCRDNATLDFGDSTNEWHQGGFFQVPIETLIPEQIDGFIAAEKNIGASRLAEGALRLQPITMATGQAAGALAGLAVQQQVRPRDVDTADVQRTLVAAGSAISNRHFTDVPLTHEAWADVQMITVDATFVGYGQGRFGPADQLTRGQAAVGVVRLYGIGEAAPEDPSFADVPQDHMFYGEIEALKRDGITAGCSVNPARFCVNDPITRFQLSVFLTAAGGHSPSKLLPLQDVTAGQQRFASVALERGWFEPCDTGFCPNRIVTRAEMAHIVALEK